MNINFFLDCSLAFATGNSRPTETTQETQPVHKRAYGRRAAHTETKTTVTVRTSRNVTAYANTVRNLGWRVFVCNDLKLSLTEAVLAYREEYIIERGFNRFRGRRSE